MGSDSDPILWWLSAAALAALGALLLWALRYAFRWAMRIRSVSRRALLEDGLRHLHHCEFCELVATLDSLAGALGISQNGAARLIGQMESIGLVHSDKATWRLTAAGRRYALRVIRVHRLWERYLADRTGIAEADWHFEADRLEHTLSVHEAEALATEMGNPRYDPHGAPIPTSQGEVPPARGGPLTALPVGELAVVVHIEDEPKAVYAQLAAQGLGVGVHVRVIEVSPRRIRLEVDGEEEEIAPVLAANVSAVALPGTEPSEPHGRLSQLTLGDRATVLGISAACRGLQRRRLLDLGLVPGTEVWAELRSPGGDPTAYRVRGALIALRKSQADLIRVRDRQDGQGRPNGQGRQNGVSA